MKPWDCDDLKQLRQNEIVQCIPPSVDSRICNDAKDEIKRCNTKVKHTWLLLFLLLIPLAVLIVIFSKWWKHYVHTNRTAAQVGGTLFELNTLKILCVINELIYKKFEYNILINEFIISYYFFLYQIK